jgi:flagellar M-ring protein FliF
VIDSLGGLILGGDEAGPGAYGTDRAAELKRNVEQLLAARVGFGKAVVEVSVDTQTDRESITEKTLDPDSRIAISTDTTETNTSAKDQKPGDVTVA